MANCALQWRLHRLELLRHWKESILMEVNWLQHSHFEHCIPAPLPVDHDEIAYVVHACRLALHASLYAAHAAARGITGTKPWGAG